MEQPDRPVQTVKYVDTGARTMALGAIIVAVALMFVGLSLVEENVVHGSNGANGSNGGSGATGANGKNGQNGVNGTSCSGPTCPYYRNYSTLELSFAPSQSANGITLQSDGHLCDGWGTCYYWLWLNSSSNLTAKITGLSWPLGIGSQQQALNSISFEYVGSDPTIGEIVATPGQSTLFLLDFQVTGQSGIISETITVDYSVVAAAPPSPPTNLQLVDAGNNWIDVSWLNPSSPVANNTVYYQPGACVGSWNASFSTGGAVSSFNLTGLSPVTSYCITVTAWSSGGQSWHAVAITAQTRAVP